MAKFSYLPENKRYKIIHLKEEGYSMRQIAAKIPCGLSTVVVAGGCKRSTAVQCSAELSCFVPTDELSYFVPTAELSYFVPTAELSCFAPTAELSCFAPAAELSCSFMLPS
ncbi:hypothetical protein TNCV_2923801 [Trichonephila clavipes]|nr:hypothetical protein TNCV_2923801 [Trichonephila clavipes]